MRRRPWSNLTLEAGAPDNVTVVMLEIAEDDAPTTSCRRRRRRPDADDRGATAAAGPARRCCPGPERADLRRRPAHALPAPTEPPVRTAPHCRWWARRAAGHRANRLQIPIVIAGAPPQRPRRPPSPRIVAPSAPLSADKPSTPRRPRTRAAGPAAGSRPFAAAVLVVLAVGLWLGYAWTQTRYYIGEHDQQWPSSTASPSGLGPIQLSTLEAVTDIRMSASRIFAAAGAPDRARPRPLRRPADRQEPRAHRHHRARRTNASSPTQPPQPPTPATADDLRRRATPAPTARPPTRPRHAEPYRVAQPRP